MKKFLLFAATHLAAAGLGFALGIYLLPILVAPPAPSAAELASAAREPAFTTTFRRDLKGSDAFHWGEGRVTVGARAIALEGRLAPGPDYKLYLSPEYVETREEFKRLKPAMVRVGDVKTFENFVVKVPEGIDPARYKAVVVWCEAFGMFITAGAYR
jgi:Electron transfer DM13